MKHYIKKCKERGTVIEQCRCPDKNKEVRYGTCYHCKTGKEAGIPTGMEYL